MIIKDIFEKDINRNINGVIKVGQDDANAIYQEVNEYVITKELRKHLLQFFKFYYGSFVRPTDDVGVWLSGHFGSGKSHLLKMMSYLLDNREVIDDKGSKKHVLDYFKEKFDDEEDFLPIQKSVEKPTETILFNIDEKGSVNKDKTAILRVFARVFYDKLGFYGSDLKLASLEKYIDDQGKTDEFRRVFEEKKGVSWISARKNYKVFKKYVAVAMSEVLGTSEEDALEWIRNKDNAEFSINELVEDISNYVKSKPKDFRLLFMADEVGQYAGESTDLLLNLQSIVETVGIKCHGQVWVICTGQQAVDELIKARMDMFSKIWDRFKTRLVLTSSSAEEVIQERILKKKKDSQDKLEELYNKNDAVLKNLFKFMDSTSDMIGFESAKEFADVYPFPKYQFIVLHKVFEQVRKSGNAAINMAVGARSMLSGFKEAAQKVQELDENALVPFHLFYDTVHGFLSNTIRVVIERCQNAADKHHGLEQCDVNVLKLLYLIRYIDDIKATVDNITILMADDIRTDKINDRKVVMESLERLLAQNYIGKTGDIYNFLTDEEQEIARDIRLINIDGSKIASEVGSIIYDDIYSSKKFSMGQYVFSIDRMIDNHNIGLSNGGLIIDVRTMADDAIEKNETKLALSSQDRIIIVLPETSYYESLEQSQKIREYVSHKNVNQLPESVRDIIKGHNEKANRLEKEAKEDLEQALIKATYYIAGQKVNVKGSEAKAKINQALEILVENVYTEISCIDKHFDSDDEIRSILLGHAPAPMPGMEPNVNALAKMEDYLNLQAMNQRKTYMSDIKDFFSRVPYGWREIDIAGIVAMLIHEQKITVKRSGETVKPNNSNLVNMLRKKTEIGNTLIAKKQLVSQQNIRAVVEFLREYYGVMDVPKDKEDDLVAYAVNKFAGQLSHYEGLLVRYSNNKYPDKNLLEEGKDVLKEILSCKMDNDAFIKSIINNQENMWNLQEDLENVEEFFRTQVEIFDNAVYLVKKVQNDNAYIKVNEQANEVLNKIRMITVNGENQKIYSMIPSLNGLMQDFQTIYGTMLDEKRAELTDVIEQCQEAIFTLAANNEKAIKCKEETVQHYNDEKLQINHCNSLIVLDGMKAQIANFKDNMLQKVKLAITPPAPKPKSNSPAKPAPRPVPQPPKPQKKQKKLFRMTLLEKEILHNEEEIDVYVENLRTKLLQQLKNFDEIKID